MPDVANAADVVIPRDLLESLVSDEDCSFDHHGGCQAHGYLSLQPGEICPHEQAKTILRATHPMIRVELSCGHFAFFSGDAATRQGVGSTTPCFRCRGNPLVRVAYSPVGDAEGDGVELPEQGRYRFEDGET